VYIWIYQADLCLVRGRANQHSITYKYVPAPVADHSSLLWLVLRKAKLWNVVEQDAKQLLAMSLQSFGLVETVKLAPKELWLEAIKQAYGDTL